MDSDYKNKISELNKEMKNTFYNINLFLDKLDFKSTDEYKRVNDTYYKISTNHYEAFLVLLSNQHNASSFVLLRTILETFVKSFYLEYIEKPKKNSVNDFLIEKKKFPSFYDMVKKLESYIHPSGAKLDGLFEQFLQTNFATYEKLSFLSHSKGIYVQHFYENGSARISQEDIFNVMKLANRFFIASAIHHLFVFEYFDEVKCLIKTYEKSLLS